ncbi:MAG: DUF3325 domain-containing protein [Cellvibrio sp.]
MLFAFALVYAGCASLCLAMDRHFQQLRPNQKPSRSTILMLRFFGSLLLIAATIYCAKIYGIALALVCLFGFVSAAAFSLILLMSYAPRFAISLAFIRPILGIVS